MLCAGILTGWIGSRNEIKQANEWARDLLTASITYYESLQDVIKIAAIRAELGYCYWRAGALDEARIVFTDALKRLTTEGNTRANAVFGLSVVEWSAFRFKESLRILTENAPLFKKISNHTLKGVYHMQVAIAPLEYLGQRLAETSLECQKIVARSIQFELLNGRVIFESQKRVVELRSIGTLHRPIGNHARN